MLGEDTGVLAKTLGMRHAFDADHIAPIDNTTRKFMAEGKRPTSTGFFFSLDYSRVAFALTLILRLVVHALGGQVELELGTAPLRRSHRDLGVGHLALLNSNLELDHLGGYRQALRRNTSGSIQRR